jgi:hypothetical protein
MSPTTPASKTIAPELEYGPSNLAGTGAVAAHIAARPVAALDRRLLELVVVERLQLALAGELDEATKHVPPCCGYTKRVYQ